MTTQVITKNAGHWPDRIFEPHRVRAAAAI